MPFIDRTYFVAELNIPKTDDVSVQENLDLLIQKREPELLQDVLGYPLYKAFMAGLLIDPIPVEWTSLLLGAEYTDRLGDLRKWRGLVSTMPVQLNAVDQANAISYVAIQADVDSQTIPVPAALIGRPWSIEKRPLGRLRVDEYDIATAGDFVSFSTAIVLNDTYWFLSNDLSLEQGAGTDKQSLIANYVYYWYLRKEASQTLALGEVLTVSENSVQNGPAAKMVRAWNEMVSIIYELVCFLNSSRSTYPDWKPRQRAEVFCNFKPITHF